MLDAQGLWAGRDLYRATPAVTRGLRFSGVIRTTAPFSRLLRHTRGCRWSILTRILTGPHSVAFYDTRGCGGPILTRIRLFTWNIYDMITYCSIKEQWTTLHRHWKHKSGRTDTWIYPRSDRWPPTSAKVHQSEGPQVRKLKFASIHPIYMVQGQFMLLETSQRLNIRQVLRGHSWIILKTFA
jgi:hypothetical protein